MARTARAVPEGEPDLTAEDQALLDQMRTDDAAPVEERQQQDDQQQPQAGDAAADGDQQGGEQEPAARQPQMVPHAAMHEERVRRQQLEKTLETERQARATLEQRTNQLLERMQQAQQPVPQQQQPQPQALPDPAADPVGHIMARLQRSEEARNQQDQVLGAVVQALTQQNQQGQQAQQAQTVQQRALAMEREFAAATPDYTEAVSYLNDLRHRQLVAAGWDDPAERQAIIAQEAMGVAQRALQANRNPAEMVYQLAKASGHTMQQAAAAVDAGAAPNGQAPSNAQRLAQIGQGQRQSQQSLGSVRGNAPPPLTAQRLLEMPNDEFEKMLATPEGRDLMGS